MKASRLGGTITLANPADAARFTVGGRVWLMKTPWWRKLLAFLRIIKRPRGSAYVMSVDYNAGTLTVDVTK